MAENMQAFRWTGLDRQGKRVSGNIQAADSKDAQAELRKREIEVVSIKQRSTMQSSMRRTKVKNQDILLFTRYLATMMASGLPILQALDVIGKDQANPNLQAFIVALRANVSGGKTLGESFAQYPEYFSQLYCSLIKTGEKSGTLDKILLRLAMYLEKSESLKRKIKKAMVYPAAIIVVATVVSLILLLFVVPHFQDIFASFGKKLPPFTMAVIHLSHFLRSYWWVVFIMIAAGVALLKRSLKVNPLFREWVDRNILRIPVLGSMLQKAIIARYTRTLAITLDAGMPIVEAMRSMADLMGNTHYSKAVLQICHEVVNGNQLYVSMSNTKLFPNMVVQMIQIGEVSGTLSDMLNKIADYYEEEVNHIVDNLSSLLEPLIMAVLGVIIGSFVIAMYLPIFKLGSLF